MPNPVHKPVVLCFSGHDPGGGAGLQADIEAVAAQGAFAATVPTCLTVQDSRQVYSLHPVNADLISTQARVISEDYPVACIKVGLLGSAEAAQAVLDYCQDHADIPLLLDPVLASGSGQALAAVEFIQPLLPRCHLLTPNRDEARRLTHKQQPHDCAQALLDNGCHAVLITGADEPEHGQLINSLFQPGQTRHWRWRRQPGNYHGSGCTLSAALAARLALGESLPEAAEHAQSYTDQALQQAFHPGRGQFIPGRSR